MLIFFKLIRTQTVLLRQQDIYLHYIIFTYKTHYKMEGMNNEEHFHFNLSNCIHGNNSILTECYNV
jgi:hypothetical protein